MFSKLPKILNSQQGIAQLAMLLLLIAGVGLSTFLVQQRTNILPFALDSKNCENGWYFRGGDPENPDNWEENSPKCQEEEKKEDLFEGAGCDGKDSVWGLWKGDDLVKLLKNHGRVPGECGNPKGGENPPEDRGKGPGESSPSPTSESKDGSTEAPNDSRVKEAACKDNPPGATKPDGYTWVAYCDQKCSKNSDCKQNTSDGFVNPSTSNWCYGGRCLKLVRDNDEEVNNQQRKTNNDKATQAGAVLEHNTQTVNINDDSVYLGKYGDALGKLTTAARGAGSDPGVKTAELDNSIGKAQEAVNQAKVIIEQCQAGTRKEGCSAEQLHELYNFAKTATRFAFFEAVGEGVPNICTKPDLGLGDQINVKANDGTEGRLSLCTAKNSSGEVERVWRVYDSSGNPHEVSNSTYQKGVGADWWNKVPADVKAKYNQGNCLVTKNCSGTSSPVPSPTRSPSSSPTPSPTRSASPSVSPGGTFTTVSAAKEACRKLVNTKWNDTYNVCEVNCGSGSAKTWYNGQCLTSCPNNTMTKDSDIGKYCTTNNIFPLPVYESR